MLSHVFIIECLCTGNIATIQISSNGLPWHHLLAIDCAAFQARISLQTGVIFQWLNFSGVLASMPPLDPSYQVFNGIAYDRATDELYVTGKCWTKIFVARFWLVVSSLGIQMFTLRVRNVHVYCKGSLQTSVSALPYRSCVHERCMNVAWPHSIGSAAANRSGILILRMLEWKRVFYTINLISL